MKRLLRSHIWLWLILPILLWLAWRDVLLDQVLQSLKQLSISQLLVLVFLNASLTILFSTRWWLILRVLGYVVPLWKLSLYRTAGFSISFLTPGPQFGGEPVQIYAIRKKHHIPDSDALASVGLDKVIELLASFSFLWIGIVTILLSGLVTNPTYLQVGSSSLILILMPTIYIIALFMKRRPFTRLIRIFEKWLPDNLNLRRVIGILDSAEARAGQFCTDRPIQFFIILFVSLMIWVLIVYEFWLSFQYLGLVLSISQILFVMVAARLALLLPLPGGIGVLEASQVLALQFLGFNPAFGVGIMILARGRDFFLAVFGVGITFLLTRPS